MDYPAQIVFIEDERGSAWRGRLLNPSACIDTQNYGRPVTGTPRFDIKAGKDGRFHVTMQGRSSGGRRYETHTTLREAQEHGIRWAGRRFRIKGDG